MFSPSPRRPKRRSEHRTEPDLVALSFKFGPHRESKLLEVGSLGYLQLDGSDRVVDHSSVTFAATERSCVAQLAISGMEGDPSIKFEKPG
jgi:hypothetical protein